MNMFFFTIILLAAALHATWNAVVKGGSDKLMTTVLVTAFAATIAMATLPFFPAPACSSWPFIAASSLLQVVYFVLVARIYRISDMSQTYPLMRGMAPLLVAISSAALIGEPLSRFAWLGVAVICAGVLSMAVHPRLDQRAGVSLALLNAVVIAGYSLIDGVGVRRSGAPVAYTLWIFLLTGIPLAIWAIATRRQVFRDYISSNWHSGIVGGFGTVASYGLALWAMTAAPVAVVAALRETSILFGTAISSIVLKEKVSPLRIASVSIIAAGAIVLRLS